ncbi:xanthine dehydrogenase family protein molybdopterin-binding subunit [Saccharolobus islandicus]|uniref:Aldehyde oxidase and xanthine dehydrogenasemolybdopterin binding n=1 Tax=Saccharolobus islandicus (strain M.14.25 / Kamchatka \|nr:xanthine dehydrogenase family protein molybdopterin-binding subunit [Sulfolobus islandicus]ACP37330.1 aldehyde oxidase and xanthine dehydrogenasemolybdopterin binding [Sulfolobus islandicus M.14.25]
MRRIDVYDLLIGKGNYVDDISYKGRYAVFIRSPYPHARIVNINKEDAERRGALVLTGKDLVSRSVESGEREGASLTIPLMAINKALYVGQPVALVIANDPYEATDLAELVQVDYEPLEGIGSIEKALQNKVVVFEDLKTNIVREQTFEFGKINTQGRHLELDLYWSRSSGNPIEPYGAIIIPTDDGLTIISNQQAGNVVSNEIQKALGVKVIHKNARQGGSFGEKFSLVRYLTVLGFAALKFNVPIKWIETRTEHLMASNGSGPERKFKIHAYYSSDGRVNSLDIHIWEDVGASRDAGQPFKPLGFLTGPYKIGGIRYTGTLVATNKNPAGAFRGAGTPPHTWALERTMDAIADDLGISKAEVRKINAIDIFPYDTGFAYYDSGNPKGLLDLALSRNDIFALRNKNTGVGLALSTDPSTPSGSERVKIKVKNNKVVIGLGFGPEGQGNEHSAVVMASRLLGISPDNVTYEILDNTELPTSFGPGGSRMAIYTFGAVSGAVEELKARLRRKAEVILNDKVVDYRDGYFIGENGGKVRITSLEGEEVDFTYTLQGKYRFNAYPFACDLAVVRIEDGKIKPIKHVVYIDPGTPIDEDLVKEQVIGGTAIGISLALYERYAYDDNANLLTTNLADYGMPTAADLPEIEVNIVPTPSPSTPYGAKGIGEIPVGIAAAAVTSAIEDVIKRRINRVPVSLEGLFE